MKRKEDTKRKGNGETQPHEETSTPSVENQSTIAEAACQKIAMSVQRLWEQNVKGIDETLEQELKARVSIAVALGFNQIGRVEVQVKLSYGVRHTDECKLQLDDPRQLSLGIDNVKATIGDQGSDGNEDDER